MPLLSVAIITQDEARNLPRTLASVSFANEIVVVDSGSTDATVAIAESFGARVFSRPWPGFAAQKNFAIAQCTGDWVLSLDADEELSPELCRQLSVLLPTNPPADAYFLKRRNLFLNRWIRHGGYYPDAKLRLFRRSQLLPGPAISRASRPRNHRLRRPVLYPRLRPDPPRLPHPRGLPRTHGPLLYPRCPTPNHPGPH